MNNKSSIFFLTLLLVSILMLGVMILRSQLNPMDDRKVELESNIESLEIRPVFYISPATIDYAELDIHIDSHSKLWRELVPAPKGKAPRAQGPNFKQLLEGVIPSIRKEMKVGGKVKVHIITPAKPRGYWVTVGDSIDGMKVINVLPRFVVFEMKKGNKTYKYEHPRQ
jgi:hypothetical protein